MAVFERVVIVGVGLLGGSIGLALRERRLAKHIVGVGRSLESVKLAISAGAIDEVQTDLAVACAGADVAVVCTPVQLVADYVVQCQQRMSAGRLITDVGSTKRTICEDLQGVALQSFCGAHPLAGSDKSGVEYAAANLFEGKTCVITPLPQTPADLTQRTEEFWQQLGCSTVRMSPAAHDEAIAQTSHLPHVVASALAGGTSEELLPLAASGWCDTTRVAGGNVELWVQILEENRGPVLAAMKNYAGSLQHWIAVLESGDSDSLQTLLAAGKQKRDSLGN